MTFVTAADLTTIPDDPDFIVKPEYIDLNKHMNVGYYAVLFDRAMESVRASLGLSAPDLAARGLEWFTHEAHLTYQREMLEAQRMHFTFLLLGHTEDRVHFFMTMSHATEGWIAATYEKIVLCARANTKDRQPWPAAAHAALQRRLAQHQGLPRPAGIGRAIAIRHPHPAGAILADSPEPAQGLPEDIDLYVGEMDFSDLTVRPEYADANGQIGLGYYTVLIDLAMRRITGEALGMGFMNMERTGKTGFVVESHITQFRKLRAGDPLSFEYKMVGLGEKVVHGAAIVRHAGEGWIAAVQEQLNICIDLKTRRPSTYHHSVRRHLESTLAQHQNKTLPVQTCRAVRLD